MDHDLNIGRWPVTTLHSENANLVIRDRQNNSGEIRALQLSHVIEQLSFCKLIANIHCTTTYMLTYQMYKYEMRIISFKNTLNLE